MNLIPLPEGVAGRLYATGFTDVGPDPQGALDRIGADTLLSLLTERDIELRFPDYGDWLEANAGGAAWSFPIDDGDVADEGAMVALVGELVERLGRGEAIVTHCGAGYGRTSLVCGLALVALSDLGLDEALVAVRAARPGMGPENPRQRAHLEAVTAALRAPVDGRTPRRGTGRHPGSGDGS